MVMRQTQQGFAHQRAADPEQLAQTGFGELGARGQPVPHDGAIHGIVYPLIYAGRFAPGVAARARRLD
jgi:hypothetical protein